MRFSTFFILVLGMASQASGQATGGRGQETIHPRDIPRRPLTLQRPQPAQVFQLVHGASLVVINDAEAPVVEGVFRFAVGTDLDPRGKEGLCDLLVEGLRQGGSRGSSGAELDRWLQGRGASLEAHAEEGRLVLHFRVLAEDLAAMLEQIASLLVQPGYPLRALERARSRQLSRVVRRAETVQLDDWMRFVAHGADPTALRHPVRSSLLAIARKDIVRFHRAHLTPERLVVGISGAADGSQVAAWLNDLLAGLSGDGESAASPEPPREFRQSIFVQPARTRIYVVERPGATAEMRVLAPGTRLSDPDEHELALWTLATGRGPSSLLQRETDARMTLEAQAAFVPDWGHAGRFEARVLAPADSARQALSATLAVIRAGLEQISDTELAAARERATCEELQASADPWTVLERAVEQRAFGYAPDFFAQRAGLFDKTTARQVVATARHRLDPDRLVILAAGPGEELVRQLATFGEVQRLLPGQLDDARTWQPPLAEAMLEALGGRSAWAELSALEAHISVPDAARASAGLVPTRQWHDFRADRHRVEYGVGETRLALVLEGDRYYRVGPHGTLEMPQSAARSERRAHRAGLWHLLHRVAVGRGLRVKAGGRDKNVPNSLLISEGDSPDVVLVLDPEHRPMSLIRREGEGPRRLDFADWRKTAEGLVFPASIIDPAAGREWRVRRLIRRESLPQDLARPTR